MRYSRQILFPAFGEEGQRKLRETHVLIAGMGGLGSPVATYLACAGVGKLTLVDFDRVDLSNLNRQILHWEEDVGSQKVLSAGRKLRELNHETEIEPLAVRLDSDNADGLLRGIDLAIDCLDTMESRFILNSACFRQRIPFIHGGVTGMWGEVATFLPGKTCCLECAFNRGTKDKGPIPVFGPTAGTVASLQAMEAIKFISGVGRLLTDRMLYLNGEEMEFFSVVIHRKAGCDICTLEETTVPTP